MPVRRGSAAAASATVAVVALLAAGCGGGGSPSVASLRSTGTTATASSGGVPVPSGQGGAGDGFGLAVKAQTGTKFAACMRKNGVPGFPDPSAQGGLSLGPGSGVDPRSPGFQKALQTCRKILPNGGRPTPQQLAKLQSAALAFSACMRAHGIKDFPDPQFSGGGVRMALRPGGDLDPRSPVFQRALHACQSVLPVKVGARPAGQGGG